jgi:phosphopantothenoylcysteine synthetase/decarboxylase
MGKRVVVIASGETERRALPHLVRHLEQEDVHVAEIRIPTRHRALTVEKAEKLIKAAWFASLGTTRPDKFMLLTYESFVSRANPST